MIKVSIYKNEEGRIHGFHSEGHAGFDKRGKDIVCAAVSALIINAMNSIETFSSDTFEFQNEDGKVDFKIVSPLSQVSELLLNSLLLGLEEIEKDYGKRYIRITSRD